MLSTRNIRLSEMYFNASRTPQGFDLARVDPELVVEDGRPARMTLFKPDNATDEAEPRFIAVLRGEAQFAFDVRTHEATIRDGVVYITEKRFDIPTG